MISFFIPIFFLKQILKLIRKFWGLDGTQSTVCSQHQHWLQEQPGCAVDLVQTAGNIFYWHLHISEGEAVFQLYVNLM